MPIDIGPLEPAWPYAMNETEPSEVMEKLMDERPGFWTMLGVELVYLVMGGIILLLTMLAIAMKSFFLGAIAFLLAYYLITPFINISTARSQERLESLRRYEPRVTGNNLGKPAKKPPKRGRRLP